ncbi:MAG: hypothetical protein ABIH23_06120 [bacterium]
MQKYLTILSAITMCLIMASDNSNSSETKQAAPPTSVELAESRTNFATMLNQSHPGNRIGYRFHEHQPFAYGPVPDDAKSAGLDPAAADKLEAEYASRPGVFVNRREVREEVWVPQDWTYYFVPVGDGFDLLWVITTFDSGINEYYSVQQCFRMSGGTNEEWRQKIALTPAFSEYDLWAEQERQGKEMTSLSYVRRNGKWEALPAIREHVLCHTPLGIEMDTKRCDGNIEAITQDNPYGPSLLQPSVDCGLMTRSTLDDTWVCGLYWEGTTHITNHHPADCLHPFVNLGPIPPHGKRVIRGKIYWMEASKAGLYEHWKRDFGEK